MIRVRQIKVNIDSDQFKEIKRKVAKKLNVEQTLDKFPNECSGGQRQKI